MFKAIGRFRRVPAFPNVKSNGRGSIGVIGCGQFSFTTIGYFLLLGRKQSLSSCYDIDVSAAKSFSQFYGGSAKFNAKDVIGDPNVRVLYIASNHASHAEYAVGGLNRGLIVYCEKPIAVTRGQLREVSAAKSVSRGTIFAGYNRPFSRAISILRETAGHSVLPVTLSCFVIGHHLPVDHWYRDPAEGTRICGNVGHWIDLAVHMLCWGNLPDRWHAHVHWSDPDNRHDDVSIALSSERGDLISILLSARAEPFEGVNETINFQQGEVIAKIDDFRSMTIWNGPAISRAKFWPKDAGHKAAVLQPFGKHSRDWREVELSSLLMLEIARMVTEGIADSTFSFSELSSGIISKSSNEAR